ncbi:hypothetical protein BCV69DRAFT_47621 [Microstroma glucosiphilum]|uniref:Uncharacterized protein n=1 Tax=Pseudomicrostroma glucosiphilum TaxID=1684307 RepID=A0A316U1D5_9BASI|nr:hypothetical protein BCV69DRAFT_47621 [Pseudomicrostroma glucosiphilum]PWN19199.1 hypothetical protein BCV69DRAFT_47621 [Pseudomicrostroma glucosiphilum]
MVQMKGFLRYCNEYNTVSNQAVGSTLSDLKVDRDIHSLFFCVPALRYMASAADRYLPASVQQASFSARSHTLLQSKPARESTQIHAWRGLAGMHDSRLIVRHGADGGTAFKLAQGEAAWFRGISRRPYESSMILWLIHARDQKTCRLHTFTLVPVMQDFWQASCRQEGIHDHALQGELLTLTLKSTI